MTKIRRSLVAILIVVMGVLGCSEDSVVDPDPKQGKSQKLTLTYSVRASNSEGGFEMTRIQFMDEQGQVIDVSEPSYVWSHELTLRKGDRLWLSAEADFDAAFWLAVQIVGEDGSYLKSECLRVDGPGTCTVEINEAVE